MTSPAARVVLLLGAGLVAGIVGSAGGTASLISCPVISAWLGRHAVPRRRPAGPVACAGD